MNLARHLRALIAPVEIGDALVPGAVITDLSTDLGLRITVDAGGREVQIEIARAEDGGRFAARSERLLVRYRDGAGRGGVDPKLGLALCQAVVARAAPREREVLDAMAREAAAARVLDEGGARVREVQVERLLTPAGTQAERYHALSPYVGCLVGCRFCYAQTRVAEVRRLEMLPDVPWGSYVDVRVNAAEVLAGELARLTPLPIKFCPIVSDPYHPIERRYRVTRACIEVIAASAAPPPVLVLTRCRLVERDLDVLSALPRAYVGVSIPTIDDEVRRHFEPRGATIAERLAILAAAARAGVRTFAVVQPLLPGSTEELASALAATCGSASIDVLRGEFGASADLADPRFAEARDPAWQRARAEAMARGLAARGVAIWGGELPPDIGAPDRANQ
jgi:DNA repair photolyase